MITSAENRSWPGDVELTHSYRDVGLPVPSLIRTTKIATIEARHADRIGRLTTELWRRVEAELRAHLDLQ
jgi:mRNA interferase MazF